MFILIKSCRFLTFFSIFETISTITKYLTLKANMNIPKNLINTRKKEVIVEVSLFEDFQEFILILLFFLFYNFFLFAIVLLIQLIFEFFIINYKSSKQMKQTLALVALLAVAAITVLYVEKSTEVDAFEQWKQQFGSSFEAGEQSYRRLIFERNVRRIESHNADKTQTYEMGINQFTIYTDEQFRSRFLTEMIVPKGIEATVESHYETPSNDIDWTQKNGVSPVKNQGQCGSCWAFSATGVIQSTFLVKRGKSDSFSEQQLVDCSRPQGNQGCNGGWPSSALNFVKTNGITTESAYPYTAKDGACRINNGTTKISGQTSFTGCNALTSGLDSGPVSVTVDARNWSPYKSGLFSNCGTGIDHAVLLVGIVGGAWKIKNSWGTGWGENGFIRLANSTANTCGIYSYPGVVPTL